MAGTEQRALCHRVYEGRQTERSVPFAIVFTKADKLSAAKVAQNVEAYKKVLSETWEELPPIFVTSSEKKQGRDEILDYIETINAGLKD